MQHEAKAATLKRLGRIAGQVRGLSRMVEEDRYCIDIVTQIAAVRAALRKVEEAILRDHVSHCVEGAIASGQLYAFNLHPIAFGSGLASVLHRAALDALRRAGDEHAYLWVAEQNPRARRFYEREGWALDHATKTEDFGGAPLTEVRYTRSTG